MNAGERRPSPLYLSVFTWAMMPTLLVLSGASLASSHDRAVGASYLVASSNPEGLTLNRIFLAGAYAAMGAVVLRHIHSVFLRFKTHLLITMMCTFAALSTAWTQDPIITAKDAVLLILSVGFVYALKERYSIAQQMETIILLGAIFAVLCTTAALAHPSTGLDNMHGGAWQGICFSKNHFGRICVFLLTPALHYPARSTRKRYLRNTYVLAMVCLIALSESRTAWLAALLYISYACIHANIRNFDSKSAQGILVIVILLTVVILALCLVNSQEITAVFNRDDSLTGRQQIWSVLMVSLQKRPIFGFGYRAFFAGAQSEGANAIVSLFALMHFMPEYAHSGYVAVVLEMGIVGLALIVTLIGLALRHSYRCLIIGRTGCIEWYVGLICLTVVVNVTEVTFMIPSYLPWLMFVLAAVGLSEEARKISVDALPQNSTVTRGVVSSQASLALMRDGYSTTGERI